MTSSVPFLNPKALCDAMTHALILAAGFGSRLGYDMPKALIRWQDACIVDHQLRGLEEAGVRDVAMVVGFQAQRVKEHVKGNWPHVRFVENPMFMDTNTGKSMLLGMRAIPEGHSVLAMNGDVVFDPPVLRLLLEDPDQTCLAVDPRVCGDEEIKYRVREGRLMALSKQVHGEGEAVGINHFAAVDRPVFEQALAYIEMQAYFERAIEHMLPYTAKPVRCISIGDLRAMEIDFPEDLEQAKSLFGPIKQPA